MEVIISILFSIVSPLIVSLIVAVISFLFNRNYIKKNSNDLFYRGSPPQLHLFYVVASNYKEKITDHTIRRGFKDVVFNEIRLIGREDEDDTTIQLKVDSQVNIQQFKPTEKYCFITVQAVNKEQDLIFSGVTCNREVYKTSGPLNIISQGTFVCYFFRVGTQVENLLFHTDYLDITFPIEGKIGLLKGIPKQRK